MKNTEIAKSSIDSGTKPPGLNPSAPITSCETLGVPGNLPLASTLLLWRANL